MTEKHSHDVNVMLFKCVSQLSKLLKEGGGGSYLNQKMFYTVQMLQCVLFIQISFEMQK